MFKYRNKIILLENLIYKFKKKDLKNFIFANNLILLIN